MMVFACLFLLPMAHVVCVCVAAFLHHMVLSAALDCFFFTHMLHVKATSTTHSHSCTRAPKFLLTYTAHNDLLCPSMVL